MLQLTVVGTGIVSFEMPPHVGLAEAEDLERALRLLSEGGCRGVIVDLDCLAYVSGDAVPHIVQGAAYTRTSTTRLVFVVLVNTVARSLLANPRLARFEVYRLMPDAVAALRIRSEQPALTSKISAVPLSTPVQCTLVR